VLSAMLSAVVVGGGRCWQMVLVLVGRGCRRLYCQRRAFIAGARRDLVSILIGEVGDESGTQFTSQLSYQVPKYGSLPLDQIGAKVGESHVTVEALL
jgi:hypothetical protein